VSTYALERTSGDGLALTREHEAVVRPRKGEVHWEAIDKSVYDARVRGEAAELWLERAKQEMHSLALFTQLASQLHVLGAPLDWSGAFARMIADEVRHTDMCLRMCEALGHPSRPDIAREGLHLLAPGATRAHIRQTIVAAFCIGETISGRMFKRALRAADVPLAREVVAAILVDETFHGELGWELAALLMRDDGEGFGEERRALAAALPGLFRHFAGQCLATRGPTWARSAPEVDPGPNFGDMSAAGYARAFFDGMEEDVVPGLSAIGLPEAAPAYAGLLAELGAGPSSATSPAAQIVAASTTKR
jgi:hypothetical protein